MKLLPFLDVPLVEAKEPSIVDRLVELETWADGDKGKLSAAFLAYEDKGDTIRDYLFQIAFILQDCLVTNKAVIEEIGKRYAWWEPDIDEALLLELQQHIELYYEKIKKIPPFGCLKYTQLVKKGKTPRTLEGPHKAGGLHPNQKRLVVYGEMGELVYGPVLS